MIPIILPECHGACEQRRTCDCYLRESQGFADSTTAEAERLALETEVKAWIVAMPIVILVVAGAWHLVSKVVGWFA